MRRKASPAQRILSAFVILSLIASSAVNASPEYAATAPAVHSTEILHPIVSLLRPEIAKLEGAYVPERCRTKDAGCPVVLHIQDAHANPEAQRHIQKMIEEIYKHAGRMQVAVESADGPLRPDVFNFLSDFPTVQKKVIDDLVENGELTGAELFLLNEYFNNKVKQFGNLVAGVENRNLFSQNLNDFKILLENRGEIDRAFSRFKDLFIKTKSLHFNTKLKKFDDEHKAHYEDRRELLSHTKVLQEWSKSVIGIDLSDSIEQLRFPNLTRLIRLSELDKAINEREAEREKDELDAVLLSRLNHAAEVSQAVHSLAILMKRSEKFGIDSEFSPRLLLQHVEMAASKAGVDLSDFPDLIKLASFQVLQSEIGAIDLYGEIQRLENSILDQLAVSPAERKLIQIGRAMKLLEKMLHGEVSRKENEQYRHEKFFVNPAKITNQLFELNGKVSETYKSEINSQIRLLERYLSVSEKFYEGAKAREHDMVAKALQILSHKNQPSVLEVFNHKQSPKTDVLILVSGGFHTDGLTQTLEQKQIPYIVASPRMFKPSDETLYARVMLGKNQEIPVSPTEETANIFRQLLTSGMAPEYSRALIVASYNRARSELRSDAPNQQDFSGQDLQAVMQAFYELAEKDSMLVDFTESPVVNSLIAAGKWDGLMPEIEKILGREGYSALKDSPYAFEGNVPRVGVYGLDELASRLITHFATENVPVSGFDEEPRIVEEYAQELGEDLTVFTGKNQVNFFGRPPKQILGVPLFAAKQPGLDEMLDISDVILVNVDPTKADSSKEYRRKIYPHFIKLAKALSGKKDNGVKTVVFRSIVPFSGDPASLLGQIRNIFDNNGAENIEVVYQPLFLGRDPSDDDIATEQIVLGTLNGKPSAGTRMMKRLYSYRSNATPIKLTDARNAELAQYFISLYISKKISSINQFTKLVQKVGGDLNAISLIAGLDARILTHYTQSGLGFKGWLERISNVVLERIKDKEHALNPGVQKLVFRKLWLLLSHVMRINQNQSELLKSLILKQEGNLQNKSAVIFGLSNKPRSAHFEDSQAVELIHWLKSNNLARITIYDPNVSEEAFNAWKDKLVHDDISYSTISMELVSSLDSLRDRMKNPSFTVNFSVIGMNHDEIRNLDPSFFQNEEKLKDKPVYDGWNIYGLQANGSERYSLQEVKKTGLKYFSLSRSLPWKSLREIPIIDSRLYKDFQNIPDANETPESLQIAVIGTGYVGLIQSTLMASLGWLVTGIDIMKSKIDMLNKGESPIYEPGLSELLKDNLGKTLSFTTDMEATMEKSRVVFVAVGTPSDEGGEIDLSQVLSAAESFGNAVAVAKKNTGSIDLKNRKLLVIKSTVTPDVFEEIIKLLKNKFGLEINNDYALGSNPEFLREGSAVHDVSYPDRIAVAGSDEEAANLLLQLYRPQLERLENERKRGSSDIEIPPMKVVVTDLISAPLGKYLANSYLASDISFSNVAARAAKFLGADWLEISAIMRRDWRIALAAFLSAGVGYGGSCFPKDVKALLYFMVKNGVPPTFLQEIEAVNRWVKEEAFVGEIVEAMTGEEWDREIFQAPLDGKQFATWGLAFKRDTDDVREAPAFDVIYGLLKAGAAVVKAHDPLPEARRNFTTEIHKIKIFEKVKANGEKSLTQREKFIFNELKKMPQFKVDKLEYLNEALSDGRLQIVEDKYNAVVDSDAVILLTEWKDYLPDTAYKNGVNFERVRQYFEESQKDPVIIAGRDLYRAREMQKAGFNFFSVSQQNVFHRSELRVSNTWPHSTYKIISIGGNSLLVHAGSHEEQLKNIRATFTSDVVEALKKGGVITHGNGPQAGEKLEKYKPENGMLTTAQKLVKYDIVKQTEHEIGADIKQVLVERGIPEEKIVIVETHVLVSLNDSEFKNPTKPVGIKPRDGPDTRERVPSPKPLRIVEIERIAQLIREGKIVITVGGGGIPVDERGFNNGFSDLETVGAVIDKDFATALLAEQLSDPQYGIHISELVISTGVPNVFRNFGKPEQQALDMISIADIEQLIQDGEVPDGSMGPKVKAAKWFLEGGNGDRMVRITNPAGIADPNAGTKIYRDIVRSELRHVVPKPVVQSKFKNVQSLDLAILQRIGVKSNDELIHRITVLTQMANLAKLFSLPVNQDRKKSSNVYWSVNGNEMKPSGNANTSEWRIEYYIRTDSKTIDVTVSNKEAGRWRSVATAETTLNDLKELIAAPVKTQSAQPSRKRQISFSEFVAQAMNRNWPAQNMNGMTVLRRAFGSTDVEIGFENLTGRLTQSLSIWHANRPVMHFVYSDMSKQKPTSQLTVEKVSGASIPGNHMIDFEYSDLSKKLWIDVTEEMFQHLRSRGKHQGRTKDGVEWAFRPVAAGDYEPLRSELRSHRAVVTLGDFRHFMADDIRSLERTLEKLESLQEKDKKIDLRIRASITQFKKLLNGLKAEFQFVVDVQEQELHRAVQINQAIERMGQFIPSIKKYIDELLVDNGVKKGLVHEQILKWTQARPADLLQLRSTASSLMETYAYRKPNIIDHIQETLKFRLQHEPFLSRFKLMTDFGNDIFGNLHTRQGILMKLGERRDGSPRYIRLRIDENQTDVLHYGDIRLMGQYSPSDFKVLNARGELIVNYSRITLRRGERITFRDAEGKIEIQLKLIEIRSPNGMGSEGRRYAIYFKANQPTYIVRWNQLHIREMNSINRMLNIDRHSGLRSELRQIEPNIANEALVQDSETPSVQEQVITPVTNLAKILAWAESRNVRTQSGKIPVTEREMDEAIIHTFGTVVERTAQSIANRIKNSGALVDFHDLVSVGQIVLLKKWREYDPDRGASFETFVKRRVNGAMVDELRFLGSVDSRKVRAIVRDLEKNYESNDINSTSEAQAASNFSKSTKRIVDDSLRNGGRRRVLSIDPFTHSNWRALEAPLMEGGADPYIVAESNEILRYIREELDERERTAVILYYFDNEEMSEIAAKFGVSPSMVSRILSAAIDKVAHKFQIEKSKRIKSKHRAIQSNLNLDTLSKRLTYARIANGYSISALAEHSFIERAHIALYEDKRNHHYDNDVLSKLADNLGVSTEWLLTGENPPVFLSQDYLESVNFRELIDKQREKKGIRPGVLAQAANLNRDVYSSYLKGIVAPAPSVVRKLQKTLDSSDQWYKLSPTSIAKAILTLTKINSPVTANGIAKQLGVSNFTISDVRSHNSEIDQLISAASRQSARSELRADSSEIAKEMLSIIGTSKLVRFVPTSDFARSEHPVLSADLSRIGEPSSVLYALAFSDVKKPQPVVGQIVKVIDGSEFNAAHYESAINDLVVNNLKLVLAVEGADLERFKSIKTALQKQLIASARKNSLAPDDVMDRLAVQSFDSVSAVEIQKFVATKALINSTAVVARDPAVLRDVRSVLRFLDDTLGNSELEAIALKEVIKAVQNPRTIENRFGVISLSDWLSAKLTVILGERQASKSA